jgi:hypothetical protein
MATTKRSRAGSGKSSTSRSGGATASKPASRTGSAANGAAKKRTQSAKTGTTRTTAKRAGTASSGAKRARSTASSNGAARARSANGSARTSNARSSSSAGSRNGARSTAAQMQDGMVGKLKQTGTAVRQAADKAGRPTITVAAAMAGLAGGLALRQRHAGANDGLTTRSMAMLHDVDAAALIGGLGKATVQLSQRSKNVARDIERVAEQAERLGKILS